MLLRLASGRSLVGVLCSQDKKKKDIAAKKAAELEALSDGAGAPSVLGGAPDRDVIF